MNNKHWGTTTPNIACEITDHMQNPGRTKPLPKPTARAIDCNKAGRSNRTKSLFQALYEKGPLGLRQRSARNRAFRTNV
jgi:hypothetical protein